MYRSKEIKINFDKNPDFLNEMLNYYNIKELIRNSPIV